MAHALRHAAGLAAVLVALTGLAGATRLHAEPRTLRLGVQAGLPHLPMIVMKAEKLVEACLAEQGRRDVGVEWTFLTGAAQVDALLSGTIDFTSNGTVELANSWAATRGRVRAVAAQDAVPSDLVTTNPDVHGIADFTDADRIAVPAVKVSPQAILLQMAAERLFGDPHRLDPLTVALRPADAAIMLLSGGNQVDTHFSVPPFQELELANPRIHRVASSYDIMGGPATVVVVTATTAFHDANPLSVQAVRCAVGRAIALIHADKPRAARAYLAEANDTRTDPAAIVAILDDPRMLYSMVPLRVMLFVDFMARTGQLKTRPDSWRDLFFPEAQADGGS